MTTLPDQNALSATRTNRRGLPVLDPADLGTVPTKQTTPNMPRISAHRGVIITPGNPRTAPLTTAKRTRHTLTDFFCGAGGSSLGAHHAGVTVSVFSNHWPEALQLHSQLGGFGLLANIADATATAWVPTTLMWSSPPCPPYSQARTPGKDSASDTRTPLQRQADLAAARGTMFAPQSWAAHHRDTLEAAVTENVVELFRWDRLDDWVTGWHQLGYRTEFVCLNSMFFPDENGRTVGQSRDRVFFIHTRTDLPRIDLDFRVAGHCPTCDRQVLGIQTYKPNAPTFHGRPYGKYGRQYTYTCPKPGCGATIAPHVAPIADSLDLNDRGTPIRDRSLSAPLKDRIALGFAAQQSHRTGEHYVPVLVDQSRAKDVTLSKVRRIDLEHGPTLTGRQVLGVAFPPENHPLDQPIDVEDCTFRMLTSSELWRLGGFPATYGDPLLPRRLSKRSQALAVGNAVTPAVARAIFTRLVRDLPAHAPGAAPTVRRRPRPTTTAA